MARPKKTVADKRDITVKVRMTNTEKSQLQNAADIEGISMSDFVRLRALNSLPKRRKPTAERAAFIRGLAELGKIGSNVNQIARSLNRRQQNQESSPVIPELVEHALNGVDTLSHHLLEMLDYGH